MIVFVPLTALVALVLAVFFAGQHIPQPDPDPEAWKRNA